MIAKGWRPKIDANCHLFIPEYMKLVQACWHNDPSKRPTADQISKKLQLLIKKER